jgi:hydroxymethylglutaryl-CoA lyase
MSDVMEPADALDPAEIALTEAPAGPGIVLRERFAGDGLPHGDAGLSLEARIALIERIADCGFRRILVPSFADTDAAPPVAEAVLRAVRRRPGLQFMAACGSPAALRRALAAREAGGGPDEVALPVSASAGDSRIRFGRTREEQWAAVAELAAQAGDAFLLVGTISAAFDCAAAGPTEPQRVLDDAERFAALGVTRIAIEDGVGSATPPRVRDLIGWLHGALPTAIFIARLGDGRGAGIANTLAAIEAGLTHVDCALGGGASGGGALVGVGGAESAGETCTEDLAQALHTMGYATGLDLAMLRPAGLEAERLVGHALRSRMLRLE